MYQKASGMAAMVALVHNAVSLYIIAYHISTGPV
nr:MAG TPA: hypothetical protein [Caudoviricetes sp.]